MDLKDQLPCFSFASCGGDHDATSHRSVSSKSSSSSQGITIKQKERIPRGMALGSLSNASYISANNGTYNNSLSNYSGTVTMVGKKSKKNSHNSGKKKTVKNSKSSKSNRGSSKNNL